MVRETEVKVGEVMKVHTLWTKRIFSLKKKKKRDATGESDHRGSIICLTF